MYDYRKSINSKKKKNEEVCQQKMLMACIKFRISYFKMILHYVKAKLKLQKTKISRHSNITMIHLTKIQRFFLPKEVEHTAS